MIQEVGFLFVTKEGRRDHKLKALGRHVLAEIYEADSSVLNDEGAIQKIMVDAAIAAKATVVNSVFHKFSPYGVSGVVIIAESHLSIHTWPEHKYAAMDFFTCGDEVDPWVAFKFAAKGLKSAKYSTVELQRGTLDVPAAKLTYKPYKLARAS